MGFITVESVLNPGSTFTIRLPLVVDAPQAVIAPRTESAAGLGRRYRHLALLRLRFILGLRWWEGCRCGLFPGDQGAYGGIELFGALG